MPAKFELIAPCFFGCESTANFELRRIGAEDIRVSDGRLTFRGGADMIAAANLNLRTVERVMLLLNTYTATTFDELFDGVYSIHWEELLPADAAFPVTGSSLNSQLSSVPACQSIIKKAVVKRLMQGHRTTSLPETGAEYKIRFMLRKNVCEIMLDTTGDGLCIIPNRPSITVWIWSLVRGQTDYLPERETLTIITIWLSLICG